MRLFKRKPVTTFSWNPTCDVCGEAVSRHLGHTGLQIIPPHVCDPNQAMWEKWAKAFVKYDKQVCGEFGGVTFTNCTMEP